MKSSRKSRKSIRYSIFIGVLAGSIFSGSGAFAAFEINSLDDLEVIDDNEESLAGEYVLMTDLNLGPLSSGASTYITGTFTGALDGNGKILSGLTKPVFDVLGGQVSDLVLLLDGVSGNGALANSTYLGTTIENVAAEGNVNGTSSTTGGLVGTLSGTISGSTFTGTVTGTTNVGGIAGTSNGNISESTFTGTVIGTTNVGGLSGDTYGSIISNSSASGTVTGLSDGENVGGLIGNADVRMQIIGSSSSGTVTGTSNVGGLAGQIAGSLISDSSSSSHVNGQSNVGGLVGYAVEGFFDGFARGMYSEAGGSYLNPEIENTFSTGSVFGTGDYVGGLVGSTTGSILDSYSHASGFAGNEYVGGLAGYAGGDISNSYSQVIGDVTGDEYVGGLAGYAAGDISNSYALVEGDITGAVGHVGGIAGSAQAISNSYVDVRGSIGTGISYIGANPVGGLVGQANDSISNSAVTVGGSISGGDRVGGLVGRSGSAASISNSHSSVGGNISGVSLLGGLVGYMDASASISNSHSSVGGNISGYSDIGGLVGSGASEITDSNAVVFGNVGGDYYIGGLVGTTSASINNSDIFIGGNLSATYYALGGLVGSYSWSSINNSNSSVLGEFSGPIGTTGGLIGSAWGGSITNSFYLINEVVGGIELSNLVGELYYDYLPFLDYTETFGDVSDVPQFPATLEIINNESAVYAIDECLNGPNPYLVSLLNSYENSCLSEDPATPRREKVVREVMQTRTSEKIEKTLGFKSDTPLPKDALVSFLQATDKIDIAKVKSLEITPTAIVRVIAKTGEALQISLKSESKDPMELWVLSPDGKWLFAGVITFDKDGKAILPPLQFKNAGDYSLALSTPSADSAKASAPLNLSGQVLVSVS